MNQQSEAQKTEQKLQSKKPKSEGKQTKGFMPLLTMPRISQVSVEEVKDLEQNIKEESRVQKRQFVVELIDGERGSVWNYMWNDRKLQLQQVQRKETFHKNSTRLVVPIHVDAKHRGQEAQTNLEGQVSGWT